MRAFTRSRGGRARLQPEVRRCGGGIHEHRIALQITSPVSVLRLHGIDKLLDGADRAPGELHDVLGRGRPEDIVALAVRRRRDREDAAAGIEGQRPLVAADAALADGWIVRAVDPLVGGLPAGPLAARHGDVVEEGRSVRERGDLPAARPALVLVAGVVAHGSAAGLEEVDAVALVIVEHVALDQEVAGVALVAAVAGALSGAAGVRFARPGAPTVAHGVLQPAAVGGRHVGEAARALRDVEDDAMALGVAGALAAAGGLAAVARDAVVALAVGVAAARAAVALRGGEVRVGGLIPGARILVRGGAAAVLREAPQGRVVLVVPDDVAANHVGPLVLPDGVPEVDRGRPAVGPVVVHLVVLEGDPRRAVRVQHPPAVVVCELGVPDGDVGRRTGRPVDERRILRGHVAAVGGVRTAVIEAPVLEPEAVDDGLVARGPVAAVGTGGARAAGRAVRVVGGAVLARTRPGLAEPDRARDPRTEAGNEAVWSGELRDLPSRIDDRGFARVRFVGDRILRRTLFDELENADARAVRGEAGHEFLVGASSNVHEVARPHRFSGCGKRAPRFRPRRRGGGVVCGSIAVAARSASRVVIDPERAQWRGARARGGESTQKAAGERK